MNGATASAGAGTAAGGGMRPPFTASQWKELEHQALIFKYMMAGMAVPPDLLLPIRKSFEALSARFFHHPTMGYCSYYGKKLDPEPGRCRRTDGKKWRCSKDAYPDSKYCERHMHRGRNRSRKPVETHSLSQSSSTLTSLSASAGSSSTTTGGCGGSGGGFHSLPLNSIGSGSSNVSSLQMEPPGTYGIGSKDYRTHRYLHGMKGDVDEHSFFSEASGTVRSLTMDSSLDSTWSLMPSGVSCFQTSKPRNGSFLQSDYPQMRSMQDFGHSTLASALSKQQLQQHSFFGSDFCSAEPVKQEAQFLRPFFDEWPKARDSWSDLDDERSNRSSFSTTQLSISIPMASSDFSATSSQSPNDD
ncbi:Growth-regulating factor 4 [Acorus gramineus]|uniref:Growth-regulating factor n=1 Tax=Acorus gramineus TaxID=55184 RepID=A0AAV9BBH9_ACOGR|nr:Growth-regulating factor 4 [Acorus gramineus]KAK1274254.1 Growth-regulating factor 4 [Acorus gramineus]